jgi:hypothetical protein
MNGIEVDLTHLNLRALGKKMDEALRRTQEDVIRTIFDESQALVPVATGALKASGKINHDVEDDPMNFGGLNPEVEITYGNSSVDYAIYVHENLDARHEAPTQAKFLEEPFARHADELMDILRLRLRVLFS